MNKKTENNIANSEISKDIFIAETGHDSNGKLLDRTWLNKPAQIEANYHVFTGTYDSLIATLEKQPIDNDMATLVGERAFGADNQCTPPGSDFYDGRSNGTGFWGFTAKTITSQEQTNDDLVWGIGDLSHGSYVYYVKFEIPDRPVEDTHSYSVTDMLLKFNLNSSDDGIIRISKIGNNNITTIAEQDTKNTFPAPIEIHLKDKYEVDFSNKITASGFYLLSFEVNHKYTITIWDTYSPMGMNITNMQAKATYKRNYTPPKDKVKIKVVNNTKVIGTFGVGRYYGLFPVDPGWTPGYAIKIIKAYGTAEFEFVRNPNLLKTLCGTWLTGGGISTEPVPVYLDGKFVKYLNHFTCSWGSEYKFQKPDDVKEIIYTINPGIPTQISRIDEISTNL